MSSRFTLNYSDEESLSENITLFSEYHRKLLGALDVKKNFLDDTHKSTSYLANGYALVAADYPRAPKYVYCGWKYRNTDPRPCNLWNFCPLCACKAKQRAWEKFGDALHGNSFDFVTLSLKQTVEFSDSDIGFLPTYWSGYSAAFKALFESGLILGAYLVSEVAVETYYPAPRIRPHVHAVVHVENHLPPETNAVLTDFLQGYLDEDGLAFDEEPSVDIRPITQESDYFNRLAYCTKSMDILTPYQKDFSACNGEAASIQSLNQQFGNFCQEYRGITLGTDRIGYVGSMMGQRKDFIGQRASRRKDTLETVLTKMKQNKSIPLSC